MNPIKIQFHLPIETTRDTTKLFATDEFVNHIDRFLQNVFNMHHGEWGLLPNFLAQPQTKEGIKTAIENSLTNKSITFNDISDIQLIPIGRIPGLVANDAKFRWQFTCTLYSIEYTCLQIVPNDRFICFASDNEIKTLIKHSECKAYYIPVTPV